MINSLSHKRYIIAKCSQLVLLAIINNCAACNYISNNHDFQVSPRGGCCKLETYLKHDSFHPFMKKFIQHQANLSSGMCLQNIMFNRYAKQVKGVIWKTIAKIKSENKN